MNVLPSMLSVNGPSYVVRNAKTCLRAYAYSQRRPRSVCVSAQSDQNLHCSLHVIESLDTTECMNGEQMPG